MPRFDNVPGRIARSAGKRHMLETDDGPVPVVGHKVGEFVECGSRPGYVVYFQHLETRTERGVEVEYVKLPNRKERHHIVLALNASNVAVVWVDPMRGAAELTVPDDDGMPVLEAWLKSQVGHMVREFHHILSARVPRHDILDIQPHVNAPMPSDPSLRRKILDMRNPGYVKLDRDATGKVTGTTTTVTGHESLRAHGRKLATREARVVKAMAEILEAREYWHSEEPTPTGYERHYAELENPA